MKSNIFLTVKNTISAIEAAERYGLHPDRYGRVLCPFHNDHRPSMQLYPENRGFYCFTCHASGSVIDLVAQIFGLSAIDAAMKICQDFGIPIDEIEKPIRVRKPKPSYEQAYNQKCVHYTRVMLEYLLKLEKWLKYGPRTPEEDLNVLYIEAISNHDRVEYITEILLQGDVISRAEIVIYHESELKKYEQRLQQITGRNAERLPTGTKKS